MAWVDGRRMLISFLERGVGGMSHERSGSADTVTESPQPFKIESCLLLCMHKMRAVIIIGWGLNLRTSSLYA